MTINKRRKKCLHDDFFYERDIYETALIKEALKQGKPIFGICRGMQLMNVILGGTLNQNILNHWQNGPSYSQYHEMVTKKHSFLQDIYSEIALINSFHHQSIKELGRGLEIIVVRPET